MTETLFSAFKPIALDVWDETPFVTRIHRRSRRSLEALRRSAEHLGFVTALLRGVEVDRDLADATAGTAQMPWTDPIRVVRSFERGPVPGRRQRALAAVDRLRTLCDLSEERAAELMGVARGTLRSWRGGERDPYGATTRHLFEVDSFVSVLVRVLGRDAARSWLTEHDDDGSTARVEFLAAEDGPRMLLRAARASVLPGGGPRLLPTADDLDEGTEEPTSPAGGCVQGPCPPTQSPVDPAGARIARSWDPRS